MNILTRVWTPLTFSKTRSAAGASTRIHSSVSRTIFARGMYVAVPLSLVLSVEVGDGAERFVETDGGIGGTRRAE